jgi:hypothetical protein
MKFAIFGELILFLTVRAVIMSQIGKCLCAHSYSTFSVLQCPLALRARRDNQAARQQGAAPLPLK